MNRSKKKNFKGGRFSIDEKYRDHDKGTIYKVKGNPSSNIINKGDVVEQVTDVFLRERRGLSDKINTTF